MSLLSKLKDLTSITHRSRSDKFDFWKKEARNGYVNGCWDMNPGNIIDQTELLSTGGTNKVGLRYYNVGTSTSSACYTRIYYYIPAYYHSNQKATVSFVNGSYTKTQTIDLTTGYTNAYQTTYLYISRVKAGTITVTIPSYYDTINSVFYTGVKYSVTFSNLTDSIVYYDVVYEDL